MKKITECRACGSKALTPVFSLPSIEKAGRKNAGVEFVLCDASRDAAACGLLQTAQKRAYAPAAEECSGRYIVNRHHLRRIATEALEMISGRDCAALDIGCNDGALLSYYPRWVERFGVDPSDTIDAIGEWAWTAKAPFPSAELDRAFGGKTFDIVTAASVLEYVNEPRAFFARVKALLADDGVFAIETLYAPMTLTQTSIEPLIGGASAVYSLGVLERALRDCELKIFRGALTDKEGGSARLFVTHADCDAHDFDPWYERLARLWDEENALSLRSMQPYQAFERRALESRRAFQALLAEIDARGERAHMLGAGPNSAAVYAWAGAQAGVIEAAVGEGGGAFDQAGVDLPVISETESRAAEPDYLIAPAALKREMMERWRESILLGARMIVAAPEPRVIHTHNYASELGKALADGGAGSVETLRAILGAASRPRVIGGREADKAALG